MHNTLTWKIHFSIQITGYNAHMYNVQVCMDVCVCMLEGETRIMVTGRFQASHDTDYITL